MTSLQRLRLSSIILFAAILLLASIQLHSQTQNGARKKVDNADYSSLMLVVDRNGFAKVNLWLPAKLDDPSRLQRALMQAVNFPLKFDEPPKAVSAEQTDESLEEIGAASWTFIKGRSDQSLSNQGMKSTTRITLQPLEDELRAAGMKRLLIGIMFEDPDAEVVLAGGTKVGPADGKLSLNYFNSEVNLEAPKTAAIEFSFGYSGADISRRCVPLAAFIFFAALLTLWQRRSALKLQEQLVEMWGRYFHFWQLLMSLIWLVWIPICAWTRLNNVISFEIGRDRRLTVETLNIALYLLPPLFTLCLCHLLSKPVYDRVSGVEWSPRDVMKRAIATNAVSLLPLFIILIVIGMFNFGSRFTGLFLILAGVAWLLSLGLVNRVFRFSVYAVSAGELRNRIFELAHKAGVAVKQVYVLPESSSQLSNAFARSDNAVMITASLLKHLTKREVDAIMAHEIGHLKEKHPQIRGHITLGAIIVTNLVASSLSSVINLPRSAAVIFSFAMLASMLILHFVSRSNERHADAIAIGLTADPESFISGLSKLSRLNLMPLNSGSWGQSLETHPRTMNRLQDIARVHGVSEQRFHELLHDPAAEDRYSTAGVESGKAFSTDFKKKRTTRVALAMMALLWFFPALLTLLLARMNLQGLAQWMVYFAGAIITFLLYLIEKNFVTALGFRRPAHALREKLAQQGFGDAARQGVLVGLAPAAQTRKYENYLFWDAGVLWLTADKLCYIGEESQFALDRERIARVYERPARPEWLADKSLFIEWRNEQNDQVINAIHFLRIGAGSILKERRELDSLHEKIKAWLAGSERFPESSGQLQSLTSPAFSAITSEPVNDRFNLKLVFKSVFMLTWISALVSFAFRLSFAGACYSVAVLLLVSILDELAKFLKRMPAEKPRAIDPLPKEVHAYTQGGWAESNPATTSQTVE